MGCPPRVLPASSLPPATTPTVDTGAPVPEGHGRLVIDVEEGPVEVRRVELAPQASGNPVQIGDGPTVQRWRFAERLEPLCSETPCVADLPLGNVLLSFPMLGAADDALRSTDLVHVSAEPTVYRRHLDVHHPRRGAMVGVGALSAILGFGGAFAGALVLRNGLDDGHQGRTLGGAISLGVGALAMAFGIWLTKRGRVAVRPGSSIHYPL
ncbi:MAG: hypothetical protein GWO04_24650 [Actinobacteria bacterium]|nr:hypothetical protein [Actinomycetota bacterium]